ncbi:hypothetical protein COLO4_24970 [Corchorus olitorius]|uniref:Cyclin N-terminal domain-containing protein n=1 Tax=Corchorus olitorius TaxID=93759 RepID=A0A1R3I5S8_9ROSI|nr:hypothetical protein COLO4_24970 [Corchorus olitorius]
MRNNLKSQSRAIFRFQLTKQTAKTGVSKAAGHSFARRSGNGGFKIYSENEKPKNEAPTMTESALGSKKVPLTIANDSKVTLKNMTKSKGKRDTAENKFAPRTALADLSNLTSKVSGSKIYDGSKPMKNERNALLDRVSVAPAAKSVRSKNSDPESVVTTSRTAKNSLVLTRKSLPVLKKEKDVANKSLVKEKASGSATKQANNAKSQLRRDVRSDGSVIMPPKLQSNTAARILPRSLKPVVKTALRASNARRTSKSNCSSGSIKLVSTTAISSESKEAECFQPENGAAIISNEASQRDLLSNENSDGSTNMQEILTQKKTKCRRSYTSLLMTRSKLLENCGGVNEEEKIPGIDNDSNPLEVAQYVDEIYQYYWITEAHNTSLDNHMKIQTDITPSMRGILINWLIEVHLKFDLMQETLYLMVTLLDRYLSEVQIKKNDLQLVGLTTLLVASKYEDYWHPRVKDLISISAEAYTTQQMLKMEKHVLKQLKFRLNVPTPYVFMLRFIKAAQSDTKLEHLAFYLIELCLVEYEALKFKPSLLCASAIYVARCTLQMIPSWTKLLCRHARYDVSEIRECAEMILRFQRAAGSGQLKVTYEKFMSRDLSEVAAIKPLARLPSTS